MTQERSYKNDPPAWFGTLLVFARDNLDALHGGTFIDDHHGGFFNDH